MALAFLPPKRGPDGGGVGRALLGPHTQGSCLILRHVPSTTPAVPLPSPAGSALTSSPPPPSLPSSREALERLAVVY